MTSAETAKHLYILGIDRPAPSAWPPLGGAIVFLGMRPPVDVGDVRLLPKTNAGLYVNELPADLDPKPPAMSVEIPDLSTFRAEPNRWVTAGETMAWLHQGSALTTIMLFRDDQTRMEAFFARDVLVFEHNNRRAALDCSAMPPLLAGALFLMWNPSEICVRFYFREGDVIHHSASHAR